MQPQTETAPASETLNVTSDAFLADGMIPVLYTADGGNLSPPLEWRGVPPGTNSVAILVEDLDSPGDRFVHWIVVGLPPDVTELPAGADLRLPGGAVHGRNDFGDDRYDGPDPASGTHRYAFRVFALDRPLARKGITKPELVVAIKNHVLAQGDLIGVYEKRA